MNASESYVPGDRSLLREIIGVTKKGTKLDLTRGSISRSIWIIALPQIITNLTNSLFHIVDMFWVGRLGSQSLAAVAIAGTLMMLLFMFVMGVGTGASAMIARAYGKKDFDRADRICANAVLLGLIISVPVSIFGVMFSSDLFRLMGASPEVTEQGVQYLSIMFSFSSFVFLTFVLNASLQGSGDSFTPMKVMSSVLVINMCLDPFLIFGWGPFPEMGISGAAAATVSSRIIASLIMLFILYKGKFRIKFVPAYLKPSWKILATIIRLGLPNSIQLSVRGIMGVVIMGIAAGFGTAAVAAFGVGHRMFMLALFPGFGFAIASASLVGQNLGAGKVSRSTKSAYSAVGFYLIMLSALFTAFLFFPETLIRLFDTNPEVLKIGAAMLRITSICLPFLALSIVLNRSLAGAGDTITPMIITLISLWGLQVPLALYLSKLPELGVNGIFWAQTIAITVSGLMAFTWFQRGKWKKIKL